ncbi:MAG: polyprenyl synthetase family protein [Gammaproteobacteria bacterium]|nr:polyprenyl synthetase family protein [Gammaproteobacteria bacterium]MBU1732727.1 polyprenyl synthetase family protein [Gammaproteobacteria bacterium]MBU1891552.1 polyprenyl synthetase family protein [Gammaproteobacteria bacterium]
MQVLANSDFSDWARQRQMHMETVLERVLPSPELAPQRLHQAMRYAVLDGGKRVRPLLAFAAGELTSAATDRVETVAAAVELIHVYSLVHDDLPCMDNDALRRGKPTCHVAFDEATALLVGDSLQCLAFQLVAERTVAHSPSIQLELIRLLALASGSRGMAGGQAIDLESVGKTLTQPELEFMHIHKTGALIRAAVILGAHAGSGLDSSQLDAINHYAKCVGLAFQVMDDILDVEASTATLGKTAGKDAEQNKPTYVSILGLEDARKLAEDLHHNALSALLEFGDKAKRLAQLADFIVQRQS